MSDAFPVPDDFDTILTDIWTRWIRGSVDRRSAFHTPVVISTRPDGTPDPRVMVLRKTDRAEGYLRFHTDVRSGKIAQMVAHPEVSVIGYDSGAKIQIRARGKARIETSGAIVDAAWAATGPSGRRSYMTSLPPGSTSPVATSGLPGTIAAVTPTLAETETARVNFSLLIVTLDALEWLHLAHDGHQRAAFTRSAQDWTGEWLIP